MKIKLIKRYREVSLPIKASFWFTICGILQKGIQFIAVPIYTRILSAEEYGQYTVFQSWYMILSIFATLNLFNYVFNNGLIKFKNDRNGWVKSLQGLSCTSTIIVFITYLLFYPIIHKIIKLPMIAVLFMFMEFLLMPSFEYWCAEKRFDYNYKNVVIITIAISIMTPLISIVVINLSKNKAILAMVTKAIVPSAFYIILFWRIFKNKKAFINRAYWRFALNFNIPVLPHFLSMVVLQQMDRIMISNICGSIEAGIYSIAYSIATLITIVNTAITNTLIPWTYRKMESKNYKEIEEISKILLIFMLLLNLFVIIMAPELIGFLAPIHYQKAIYIIPPVAISTFFMFMYCFFTTIEYYFEETRFVMYASVFSAILNGILNLFFIRKYGFLAAGFTTLVCYIIFCMGHYYFMSQICKKHISKIKIYNNKFLLLISCIAIAVGIAGNYLYSIRKMRYLVIILLIPYIIYLIKKVIKLLK